MEKIREDILCFTERMANRKGIRLEEVIKEYNLELILTNKLETVQDKGNALKAMLLQQKRNSIFIHELAILQEKCKNARILVLKGLANAYDLYKTPDIRMSGDIDLLVEAEMCDDVENALFEMGYKEKGEKRVGNLVHYIGDAYSEYIKQHNNTFDAYTYKHYVCWKNVDGIRVEIELHKYLYGGLIRCPNVSYPEIFDNCRRIHVNSELCAYTLSVEDTLLHSACHMAKHMTNSIRMTEKEYAKIDTKSILDIKLLVSKYKLEWREIEEKASRWQIAGSLLLGLRMVNFMFPGTIPIQVIESLTARVLRIREKKSHESLVYAIALLDMEKVYDWDFATLFRQETIDISEKCYVVKKGEEDSDIIELFGEKIKTSMQMWWDDEALFLHIKYTAEGEAVIFRLTVCAEMSHLYSTNLVLKIANGKVSFEKEHMNTEITDCEDEWLRDICYCEKHEELHITIPWRRLKIIPQKGDRLPFGVKVILLNNKDVFLDSVSKPRGNYYDYYGLCSICLI